MNELSLDLKYRPTRFSNLVGQKKTDLIRQAIAQNRHHHCYLLSGFHGCGKTTTARIIAASLNCLERKLGEPCGKCNNCRKIFSGNHLDVTEIDAASNNGVDYARTIAQRSQYKPVEGFSKVWILDEAHQLTKPAFNALLKTFEESSSVFLLCTTELSKIPKTIQSRAITIEFHSLDGNQIYSRLEAIAKAEQIAFDTEGLLLIAYNAQGSLRNAINLLALLAPIGANKENVLAYSQTGLTSEITLIWEAILKADTKKLLRILTEVLKTTQLEVILRDLLALCVGYLSRQRQVWLATGRFDLSPYLKEYKPEQINRLRDCIHATYSVLQGYSHADNLLFVSLIQRYLE